MDPKLQLTGLNEFLAIVYGNEMQLTALLRDLGFEKSQIEQMRDQHLEPVVHQFLEVIHKRLTNDAGKDTYYQILSRRYGLDGEPREQLSAIAPKYNFSAEHLRQLFEEIVQRCQSKTWQTELRKSLKHIVVAQLGKLNERPAPEHVTEKLERLTNLRGAAEVARLNYEAKRTEILKQVQAELDALDIEYKPVLEAADENIATLENEIKTDVLLYGESISGGMYRASYMQGRVSWDSAGMAKYAASHPDVLQFRKQGQPIVSLRVMNID
jgi:DNA-directed RNA polymerase sigma subunit (sigma70/sigma32)